jgi:alkylhydroperoxidase family enzyme
MSAEPRIGPLPRTQWDPRTSAILEQMPLRSGDQPLGIFTTLAHHPPLMRAFMELGDFLLTKGALPPRTREILILRTAWNCGSSYEWGHHVNFGRTAGLSDIEIATIATTHPMPNGSAHEQRFVGQRTSCTRAVSYPTRPGRRCGRCSATNSWLSYRCLSATT